jgi:hypothetical protein
MRFVVVPWLKSIVGWRLSFHAVRLLEIAGRAEYRAFLMFFQVKAGITRREEHQRVGQCRVNGIKIR